MNDNVEKHACCPFYCEYQNDKYRIKCEGIIPETTVQLTFKGNKKWYIKGFCCQYYEKCRVFRMLNEKTANKRKYNY